MEANELYQFSLLDALMAGVSEDGITVKDLLSKSCNQGLGTFARMDGELILLDDKVYQLQPEGHVSQAGPNDKIPFALATNFVAQKKCSDVVLENKPSIDKLLDEQIGKSGKNLFTTFRVEGSFSYLKCRTVRGQEFPGQSLKELGKRQSVEEYEDVRGTIVGFRSPQNWQGFSVAGDHMHFITADRKKGGHVLELRSEGVQVLMAVANKVRIELPQSDDFNSADLTTDDEGVKAVEG